MQFGSSLTASGQSQQTSMLKTLFDPQRIAMTILNISMNNVISTKLYILCLTVDSIFYFYHLTMIAVSFTIQQSEQNFWHQLEYYINQLSNTQLLVVQLVILAINMLLVVLFMILLVKSKGFVKLKKGRFLKQIFMLTIALYTSVLCFPILNLIIRTLVKSQISGAMNIGGLTVGVINFIFMIAFAVIYNKVSMIRMPAKDTIPWAKSDDLSELFTFLFKIFLVVIQVEISINDGLRDSRSLISIFLLLANIFTVIYTFVRCHFYSRNIDFISKLILICGCGFLIDLNICIGYGKSFGLLYYEVPIMCVQLFFVLYFLQKYFDHYLLSKSTFDSFKMEFEYTYFLILIQEQLSTLQNTPVANCQHIVSALFSQVSSHRQTCTSQDCFCQFQETVKWIQDQRNSENQETIVFTIDQLDDINSLSEENDFFIRKIEQANFSYGTYRQYEFKKLKDILQNDNYKVYKQEFNSTKSDELELGAISVHLDQNQETQQKKVKQVKIDIKRMYECYFGNMMNIYFEYGQKRYSNNHAIIMLHAYYQYHHLRNVFQCTNTLQKLTDNKFGILQRINLSVNELYLNYQINKLINEQIAYEEGFNFKQMGKLNDLNESQNTQLLVSIDSGEFIEYQNLLENFKASTLNLSYLIFNFWKQLSSPELSIQEVIKTSLQYADQLGTTQQTFNQLSQMVHHHSSSIYYQYAILNKELLNDKENYQVYLQKFRHIQNIQKTFSKEIKSKQQQYHDLGIIIVNASHKSTVGKILKCNDFMQTASGYKQDELKGLSYEKLMNSLIATWHQEFMNNFFMQGQSSKVNKKKINQFLLQKNGHITPIEITIKYYFNEIYGYSFTCFIQQIKNLTLEFQQYNTDQLIFILCDNINGKISDISENAEKHLGIKSKFIIKNQSYLQQDLLVSDLIPLIEINKINEFCENNKNSDKTSNQFKGQSAIDLQILKHKMGYNVNQNQEKRMIGVDFYMFTESYLHNKYQMNILILKLNNTEIKEEEKGFLNVNHKMQFNSADDSNVLNMNSNELSIENEEEQFSSGSSASSSSHSPEMLKAQELLFKKHLPRRIKIVIQLIAFMFLSMIIISIINLNLQTSKQQKLIDNIEVVRQGFVKIHWGTRLRLSVRLLISLANGFESVNSTLIPDKTQFIYSQILIAQKKMLDAQIYIDNANFDFSPKFGAIAKSSYIPVEYLGQKADIYKENHTMTYLINTMSAKALEIYNMDIKRLKGRLEMQTIYPAKKPFTPTNDEQTIFWTGQNGNNAMRLYNFGQADAYANDIKLFAKENLNFMQTTMIISIATIMCVFVIITPIIGMVFDKQFLAIKFFLEIPRQQKMKCFNRTSKFLDNILDEHTGQQSNISKGHHNNDISDDSKSMQSVSMQMQTFSNDHSLATLVNQTHHNHTTFQTQSQNQMNDFVCQEDAVVTFNKQNYSSMNKELTNNDTNNNDQSLTFNHDATHKPKQIPLEKNPSSELSSKIGVSNEQQQADDLILLNKQKNKRRWVVVIANFVTMSLFSLYFVATYLISEKLYSSIDLIIPDLITIYFKDICIENLMIYSRENQIRNYSLIFPENGNVASSSFLQRCFNYENLYRQIRKNPHPAFQYAIDYIEIIETSKMCDFAYESNPSMNQKCKTAYDGVLNKGVSSTIALILQYFQRQDLKFILNKQRTYQDLLELNLDEDTMRLIETKIYILEKIFTTLKEEVTQSVGTYFNSLTTSYIILFSCFTTFLIVFICLIFGFIMTKIQNYLWKINLSLKILPSEGLNKKKIQEIKAFLLN